MLAAGWAPGAHQSMQMFADFAGNGGNHKGSTIVFAPLGSNDLWTLWESAWALLAYCIFPPFSYVQRPPSHQMTHIWCFTDQAPCSAISHATPGWAA